tara:strand:+ start:443 stop:1648 length:1206 start_codon:yes stop_codon:yes gene_type:complete
MTISVSNNTPRVSYSVSQGATTTSFTVSFEFFAEADLKVYIDDTLKTLTTHYSVSGGNGSTGTVTMSVTGASGGSTVVITRDIALERTTDFPTQGAFNISSLNTELDKLVAIDSDVDDTISRSVRLQDSDASASMELPLKASRVGTVLGFNATTGAAEAGPTITAVQSLSAVTTSINLLGTAAVVEDMGLLATSAVIEDMGLLATSGNITAMGLLGVSGVITDMGILGTAAIVEDMGFLGTSANVTAMGHLGTSANVTAMGLLGTAAVVEDMGLLGTSAVVADMASLAGSGANPNITTLTASGEIVAASLDISGNVDIDGILEADAMTLNGTSITATATLSTGISNNNVPKFTSGVADDDFLRVNGTAIEGRSSAELLSDIGATTEAIAEANSVALAIALG